MKSSRSTDLESAVRRAVLEAGDGGATVVEIASRLDAESAVVTSALDRSTADGQLLAVDGGDGRRWIAPASVQAVMERARQVMGGPEIPVSELIEQVLPDSTPEVAEAYSRWMTAAGILVVDGDVARRSRPGRRSRGKTRELSTRLLRAMEDAGLSPPSPPEISRQLRAKPQIIEGLLRSLVDRGKLVELSSGLLLSAKAIEEIRRGLLDSGWQQFSVSDFKTRFALSRKWAIPILEHLDAILATRRVGDRREILDRKA